MSLYNKQLSVNLILNVRQKQLIKNVREKV